MIKRITLSLLLTAGISMLMITCKKKDDSGSGSVTNASYAGTWTITDDHCTGGSFIVTITATGTNGVTLANFRKGQQAAGWNLTGTVSGNSLTIAKQSVTSSAQGGPYQFTGSGTLNGNAITIPYVMADAVGNYPQNCNATGTK